MILVLEGLLCLLVQKVTFPLLQACLRYRFADQCECLYTHAYYHELYVLPIRR